MIKKEIEFAGKKLSLETGELAVRANMAVKVTYGETVVLVTAVSGGLNPDLDYFPLSTVYEEKMYASGTIKSSRFVKRGGRPTDHATITRRLVDHAIRPLFPSDFKDSVQVVMTILSLDEEASPEFASMIGTSAALQASDIPFNGPVTTAIVGYANDEYVLNPAQETLKTGSELEMTVSFVGNDKKFLAIEAESHNLSEQKVLGAIEFARDGIDEQLKLINDFAKEVNPDGKKYEYESQALEEDLVRGVEKFAKDRIIDLMNKKLAKDETKAAEKEILDEIYKEFDGVYKKSNMDKALYDIKKKAMQHMILVDKKRADGRALDEVRDISASIGLLPRTHGSGLFNRGKTQALTVATLGSPSLELLIQDMYGERTKRYMHFYNFPPYSVGEAGRIMGPRPRDIGHGMLAEKGLKAVIPDQTEFPYTVLLTSEILSSDGSSSMAATCGSTLALMDAGVPIKDMVAGVATGLIADVENEEYLILTDISGTEDGSGHMDFKIAGTATGITAIQVDMKVMGIPMKLLPQIFERSKTARLEILDEMKKVIDAPKSELSKYAPKTVSMTIEVDKIGTVIGSGGKVIKEIQTQTETDLSIEEDGTVFISGTDKDKVQAAVEIVEALVKEVEVGEIYEGTVEEVLDFGAIVEILPGRSGLLHVSELAHGFVKTVTEHVNIGDKVKVKVIETGHRGKISLSMKALQPRPEGMEEEAPRRPSSRGGYGGGRGGHSRGGHRGGRDSRGGRGGHRGGGRR